MEAWERRWQLARQRTDAKIIELRQIGSNVQARQGFKFFLFIKREKLEVSLFNFQKCNRL